MATPPPESLSPDNAFDLLSNPERRCLLYVLWDHEGGIDDLSLARQVVARQRNVAPEAVHDEDVERALVGLRHAHLPKLAEAAVVQYDTGTGEARLGAAVDDVLPLLQYAQPAEDWY